MGKDLKTLIRIKSWNVDEKRRALAEVLRRENEIISAQEQLEAELRREQQVAAQDSEGAGFTYGAYATAVIIRREALERQYQSIQALIAEAQEDLAEAYRELKTFEITQANREKREQEEENRREQAIMDEIGLTLFRRSQNENSRPDGDGA
ncbi:MAG: flagellar export protein FliJ [Alphaproteobacteria bacterium]|nr:flagellar export protein FliJ [Alphaproteobacteria bacterium]MBF0130344.1 flagellar export protein FliJ [Alphaproteobacteria bacterium]